VVLRDLKTKAPGAQLATCSPAEVANPRTSCRPSGPIPNGLVQSITILPRLPRLLTAASVAGHGVAIATISAPSTASASGLTRSLGRAAYFGSAALRKPQTTSSPCLSHA